VRLKIIYARDLAAARAMCCRSGVKAACYDAERNMTDYTIGMDLGGTNLRAAAIDRSGRMMDKISGATNFTEGREAVLSDVVDAINWLREKHGAQRLAGIGLGIPALIRMKEAILSGSNNLPYLENVPIRDEISRRLDTFVILENDANAAALGEKWMGAGRDVDDLVLLTLGTGVGGGIIVGGRVLRGSVGMAGEFGHMTVVPNGNPCGCGNQGCLEKHASATAVTAMARLMQLGEELSSREVYEIARRSDESGEKARRIWRVFGEILGMALATLINAFNFPLYLLSGGLLPAWEFFEPHMTRVATERSFTLRATKKETRIAQATLGNEAGLYGAAYLPWIER